MFPGRILTGFDQRADIIEIIPFDIPDRRFYNYIRHIKIEAVKVVGGYIINGEFFESQKLEQILARMDTGGMTAGDILSSIIQSVSLFSGNRPPEDDMTVIVIKVNGNSYAAAGDRLLHLAG
ncbi:MAG: SpoIIE family protein phosphatase [Candidatus Latescibacteria bacterium]|nr:SpoIIE family protein phosphatase [Candidatus Latescibacterota bacterium]